jgi:hypothetical protein
MLCTYTIVRPSIPPTNTPHVFYPPLFYYALSIMLCLFCSVYSAILLRAIVLFVVCLYIILFSIISHSSIMLCRLLCSVYYAMCILLVDLYAIML